LCFNSCHSGAAEPFRLWAPIIAMPGAACRAGDRRRAVLKVHCASHNLPPANKCRLWLEFLQAYGSTPGCDLRRGLGHDLAEWRENPRLRALLRQAGRSRKCGRRKESAPAWREGCVQRLAGHLRVE